jgi:hypothetical protein
VSLWLRVRRRWVLAGAFGVLALGLVILGDRSGALPTVIGGGSNNLLWSSLIPLAWAAALAYSFDSKAATVETRPGHRLIRLDTALFVATTAGVDLLFLGVGAVSGPTLGVVAHVMILSGLACSLTLLAGAGAGIMGATALLLLTSSYNPRLEGARYVRVLQPEGALRWSLLLAMTLVGLAIYLMARGNSASEQK